MDYPYLAAGYYPPSHNREEWPRDLDNMRDAGIRLVRTAEICCAWDQLEPVRGQFELAWLDELFDLCEERGMYVLLGTGTASPPYWLRAMYEDVVIVNANGIAYPNNASYSWACFDHPGFKEEAGRYLRTIVERYKGRKALFGYQIHNEVGFPFMPLQSGEMEIYCYCKHSIKAFRRWLENKYGRIEELNKAYRWNATNERYTSFDQVDAPKAPPTAWSSVTRWIDWRKFWMDNTAAFIKWQNDIIKQIDAEHPTTTNTFFMKSQDPFGVRMGLDQMKIAESVDLFGIDIYPGSGNKAALKPECSSMCLDMGRSVAEHLRKPLILLETESGPINGWVMGPDRNVNSWDIWRNVFDAFGHGAELALFQGYRDWDYQPLQWGGLTELDGSPTARYYAVKQIHGMLLKMRGVIEGRIPRRPRAAIVLSKENAIAMQGMGQEKFLLDAYRGIYTALWNRNIEVDVIDADMLKEDCLSPYKLLCLPLLATLSEEDARQIGEFVYKGGFVLAGARLGMLDRRGWRNHSIPCKPLDEVFGLRSLEAEAGICPKISFKGREYEGFWHKELLSLSSDTAQADALFEDASAAAVSNRYGKGRAFYMATQAEIGFIRTGDKFLPDYLERVLDLADIRPVCECAEKELNEEFDCHVIDGENESVIIVTCRADRGTADIGTRLIFRTEKEPVRMTDLFNDEEAAYRKTAEGTYEIPVRLSRTRANLFSVVKENN